MPETTRAPDGPERVTPRRAEFEYFVGARSTELAQLAYLLTGDRDGADSIAGEVLHALWRDWDHIGVNEGSMAFARRTLVSTCLRRTRRTWDRAARGGRRGSSPGQDVALRALLAMPGRRRACVVLVHAVGLSARDAAACVGVSERTAASHAAKGAAALRTGMTPTGADAPSTAGSRTVQQQRFARPASGLVRVAVGVAVIAGAVALTHLVETRTGSGARAPEAAAGAAPSQTSDLPDRTARGTRRSAGAPTASRAGTGGAVAVGGTPTTGSAPGVGQHDGPGPGRPVPGPGTHVPPGRTTAPPSGGPGTPTGPPAAGPPAVTASPGPAGLAAAPAGTVRLAVPELQDWFAWTDSGWERAGSPAGASGLFVTPPGRAADGRSTTEVTWTGGRTSSSGTTSTWLVGGDSERWTVGVGPSAARRALVVRGGGAGPGLQITVRAGGRVVRTDSWDDGPSGGFTLTVDLPAGDDPWTVLLEPTDSGELAVGTVAVVTR